MYDGEADGQTNVDKIEENQRLDPASSLTEGLCREYALLILRRIDRSVAGETLINRRADDEEHRNTSKNDRHSFADQANQYISHDVLESYAE